MKIDNSIILNELLINIDTDNRLFKEGDVLDGKVLKTVDHMAIIDIQDLGTIKAFVGNNLEYYDGRILRFLVKSSFPDKVELKPILEDRLEGGKTIGTIDMGKDYSMDILEKFHIEDNPISRNILETLIRYNVKINEDNLIKSIKIYDKLDQLLDTEEGKFITLINPEEQDFDIKKADIMNFLIENKEKFDSKQLESLRIDDKNLIIDNIEHLLEECLGNGTKSDLIKIIGFFIKFNIKPTLNNFRYMLELKEDPLLFSEDFKILEKILDKKFTNFVKKVNIDKGSYNISIGENNNRLKQVLKDLKEYIKEDRLLSNRMVKQTIENIEDRIEFIEEMNKELSFVYFPLNLNEKDYKGLITFFKNKKQIDGFKGKLNIFIDMKTRELGDIKISCQVIGSLMDIKFIDLAREDLNLFKSKEELLKDLIEPIGYSIGKIEYLFIDDYSILDSLVVNENPTCFLDVRV